MAKNDRELIELLATVDAELRQAETQELEDTDRFLRDPRPEVGIAGALLQGMGKGVSFGFVDEMSGVIAAAFELGQRVLGTGKIPGARRPTLEEAYRRGRDVVREEEHRARKGSPVAFGVGEIGGSIFGSGASVIAKPLAKAGLKEFAKRAATEGAVAGAGEAEEGDTLAGIATGAIGGAIGVGVGAAIGTGAKAAARKFLAKKGTDLKKGIIRDLVQSTGATPKEATRAMASGDAISGEIISGPNSRELLAAWRNPSEASLSVIASIKDKVNTQLDEAYEALHGAGKMVSTDDIRTGLSRMTLEAERSADKLEQRVVEHLTDVFDTQVAVIPGGETAIPFSDFRKFVSNAQRGIDSVSTSETARAQSRAAAGLRRLRDTAIERHSNTPELAGVPEGALVASKRLQGLIEIEGLVQRRVAKDVFKPGILDQLAKQGPLSGTAAGMLGFSGGLAPSQIAAAAGLGFVAPAAVRAGAKAAQRGIDRLGVDAALSLSPRIGGAVGRVVGPESGVEFGDLEFDTPGVTRVPGIGGVR